jgi:hypothetical protein
MGGALGDSSWMSAGEVPLISFHVPSDGFAPYGTDILNVPTQLGPQPVVEVSGSFHLARRAESLGLNEVFKTIPADKDPYGAFSTSGYSGLYPFDNTPNNGTSAPWEWTDITNPNLLAKDCNSDGAVGRTYIDTIVGYFAPRACVALGLDCFSSSTNDLTDSEVNLKLYPNPAKNEINVKVNYESPVLSYKLYDITGSLRVVKNEVNSSEFTIHRNELNSGIFILKLQFKEGSISKLVTLE